MPVAIRLAGRVGRHGLINDTYEPMQIKHNGKACWVARATAPRYLFHSGKSRWVVSKQLDDGARCWAYVSAPPGSPDPSVAPGPWTVCDSDGEWRPDPTVTCEAVPATVDKFMQLRMTLDADMRQYGLIEQSSLKALWRRLDYNGNGIVSLAEVDKLVVEMVEAGSWPGWLNNKPALMRAYQKTTKKDGDGDDWVERHEFHALLLNIFWFNKLFQVFQAVDSNADRRIDRKEFQSGLSQLGLLLSEQEAAQEFDRIDSNHGGMVLFVEFCAYVRKRVNPDAMANFDADIVSGEKCGQSLRKHSGNQATAKHFVNKKCFKDFEETEAKLKALMKDTRQLAVLWDRLDFNGNGAVSLAEIDKLVVEVYPVLNHKPALMRAYKKTIREGNGDDWVQKKEFKSLLAHVFYFNKLFWIFDHVDGLDRRVDFSEFQKCLALCGLPASQAEARSYFGQVDRNGGGQILFDEFCAWFTGKACPEALTAFVE